MRIKKTGLGAGSRKDGCCIKTKAATNILPVKSKYCQYIQLYIRTVYGDLYANLRGGLGAFSIELYHSFGDGLGRAITFQNPDTVVGTKFWQTYISLNEMCELVSI
ncbi:hypothetical protein [Microbulbifer sp. PAAF003]|uniref:hypothetical protein n=1 Tax=unclassified Microbulbifer TaxID=2619833 RepID=UPI00403A68E3